MLTLFKCTHDFEPSGTSNRINKSANLFFAQKLFMHTRTGKSDEKKHQQRLMPHRREAPVESHTAHNQPSLVHVKRKANKKSIDFQCCRSMFAVFHPHCCLRLHAEIFDDILISSRALTLIFSAPAPASNERVSDIVMKWIWSKKIFGFFEAGVNNTRHRNYGTKLFG